MIDKALDFLTTEIDKYITLQLGPPTSGTWAVLSNVATETGNWAIPNDTLGVSLINIEEERVFKDQQTAFRDESGQIQHYNPELKLNLYILVTAHFVSGETSNAGMQYIEGLKRLSTVISFFQGKNVFTPENTPSPLLIESNIKKLIVELYSYSFEQQYNFWTVIGAKYLPSVLYRVRLLTFQERRALDQTQPIEVIDSNLTQSE